MVVGCNHQGDAIPAIESDTGEGVCYADDTGTDIQKVLRHAVELGVTEAVLLGFTGGRTDHLLWNLSMLKTFADRLSLRLVDAHCDMRLIDRHIHFHAPIGQKISLCPLKFALQDESLIPGIRDGISNEVIANPVEIQIGQGELMLCLQRQEGLG